LFGLYLRVAVRRLSIKTSSINKDYDYDYSLNSINNMFLKLFSSIQDNLVALAQEKIGSPMLYDLIEVCMVLLPDLQGPVVSKMG
jgi:hypothetical protein